MAKSVTINSSTKEVTVTQGGTDATSIQGKSVSDSAPSDDQILAWIASASEIQWKGVDDLGSGFVNENGDTMSGLLQLDAGVRVADDQKMAVGDSDDHWFEYNSSAGELRVRSADVDGGGTAGTIFSVSDGQQNLSVKADIDFPNITGTPSFGDHDHSEGGMSTVPNSGLTNSSVTVTAGDGLKSGGSVALGSSVTLDIKPADFAGTFLSDDGSDNLQVDIGTGLQNDGSGSIQVDAGDINTGILGVSQGGTGLDSSGVTAGQLLIGHGTNSDFALATLTGGNAISVTNADGSITLDVPTDSIQTDEIDQSIAPLWTGNHQWADDTQAQFGATPDYWLHYDSTNTRLALRSADVDGVPNPGDIFRVADGQQTVDFQATPTVSDTNVVLESRSLIGGDGVASIGDLTQDRTVTLDLATSAGLKFSTGQLAVEPADFAGTFLSDDGSDNLTVDLGTGLQNDGSGNIQVDAGAVDTGILGVGQGGTGLDSSSVTAGQLLVGHGTDNDFVLSTLTGGNAINVTNADGSITLAVPTDAIQVDEIDQSIAPAWTGEHDFSGGGMVFPTATTPSPTTEGDVVWDTDDDKLRIGDGVATVTIVKESRTLTGGDGIASIGDLSADRTISADLAASGGLKFASGQITVEPTDFAGTFLSDDGSDNLQVDIGTGLQNDGSGNIQVDAGSIDTGILGVSQGGTGLDSSSVTAGQLLIGDGTNGDFSLSTLTGGDSISITNADGSITIAFDATNVEFGDDETLDFGAAPDYWHVYDSTGTQYRFRTADSDGGGTTGDIFTVQDGGDVLDFASTPTVTGTNVVLETRSLTGGDGIQSLGDLSSDRTVAVDLTASGGLKIVTGTISVEPADFAGTFLSDDGSDNLTVDLGTGLQNDGSGNIQVDAGAVDTGILGVSQGGTGVDGSTVTAGQLLIGHATNSNFSLATLTGGNAISITNADGSITLDVPTDSIQVDEIDQSIAPTWTGNHQWDDDTQVQLGAAPDYWFVYNSTATELRLRSADTDGVGTTGTIFSVADGGSVLDFSATPTVSGTNVVLESRSLTGGDGIASIGDLSQDRTIAVDLTTSGGLKIETGTISVEPADFAGTFLSDDGSDNLQVDIGTGLQNDGSGNIQVDAGAVDTGILGVSQGGTGLDSSGVTAGQLLIGHGTNGNFNLSTLTGGTNVSITNADGSITIDFDPADVEFGDDETLDFGATPDYWHVYDSTGTQYRFRTADNDGGGTTGDIFTVQDGSDVVAFTSTPTAGGTAVVLESRTLTGGDGIQALGDLSSDRTVAVAPGDFTGSGLTTSGSPANIDVGAGTAITVNANDVQVTAGGITTTELDLSISPAWTGTHDFSGGGFIFPTATTPSPTTEGRAIWDTDDDKLRVGDGTAAVTLVDEGRTLTGGDGIVSIGDLTQDRTIAVDLTSSGGLKIETGTISVEPADFAGTGLQDDGSDNLQVDASSVDTGTLGVSVGGTGVDASTVTAGQLLIGNATNSDFDLATLTGGDGVAVTNADGSVTLAVDLVSSGGLSFTAGELGVDESSVDHDSLQNFVANEHIDWTADQGATNITPENFPHDHTEGALAAVPNAGLVNDSVTVAGQSVSLGGSTTVAVEHLSNAALPSVTAAGQLLIWDATDGQFENATLTGGNSLSVTNADASITLDVDTSPADQTAVGTTRTISTGTGLSGGGDLSADRTLSVDNYANLARLDLDETVSGAWTFNATPDFTTGIDVNGSSFADASGNLVVSNAGPHAIGASSTNWRQFNLGGSFTSGGGSTRAIKWRVSGGITAANGDTDLHSFAAIEGGSITTQGNTETISDVVTVFIDEPVIVAGTGDTITNASTLKIADAPTEGSNNRALWVASGLSEFDGAAQFDSTSTFNGDMTLGMASQNYTVAGRNARLTIQGQSAGGSNIQEWYTADGDGTDNLQLALFAVGTPSGLTDREQLQIRYDATDQEYWIRSEHAGTGSDRPIKIFTFGSTNQIVARTDGNVAMSGSLKVGGTGAAAQTLHVEGPVFLLDRASTNAATVLLRNDAGSIGDDVFSIQGRAPNSAGDDTIFGNFDVTARGFSDGAEDGRINLKNMQGGTRTTGLRIEPSGDVMIATPTSTTGTSLVVSGSGLNEIARDSSSRRYKDEIEVLRMDSADVLAIDPVTYERDGRPEVGFIAEDWEQGVLAHGLGYDEHGRVHGFLSGSRVIDAAQQVVLQDHESRIKELEAENKRLRTRLNQIEA